jgi:hypothetical protein
VTATFGNLFKIEQHQASYHAMVLPVLLISDRVRKPRPRGWRRAHAAGKERHQMLQPGQPGIEISKFHPTKAGRCQQYGLAVIANLVVLSFASFTRI